MARVLMVSLVYRPDVVSTAGLVAELAGGLADNGHRVAVLTSMPHYNPPPEAFRHPTYRPWPPRLCTDSYEDGVRVVRLYMPRKGRRVWKRALECLWFHLAASAVCMVRLGRYDVMVVTSPPITLGANGCLLARLSGAKLVYDLRELWPDVPIRLGILRGKLLIGMVRALEAYVYRRAAAITCQARTFLEALAKRGVEREKLHFTPAFVDLDLIQPGPKSNGFAKEQGLEDRFVLLYAGNIGLTQGVEILIEVARLMQGDAGAEVVIIGEGAQKAALEKAVRVSGLNNIRLLPYQPAERVAQVYATADICVSPMRAGFSYDTIPSKIYSAMAAGKPVVAAAERDSESGILLAEAEAGLVVEPESAAAIAEAVQRIRRAPELARRMGENGRRWIMEHYTKTAVVSVYDRVVREICGK